MKLLITGVAGFIGFHTALYLLKRGDTVVGIDNLNDYYDPSYKLTRLSLLEKYSDFTFNKIDISKNIDASSFFSDTDVVIHLAARPGVRESGKNPNAYIRDNIDGFNNLIENCRVYNIKNLIYASSSSVYGQNAPLPYNEEYPCVYPASMYAATKICNEKIAAAYSKLYNMNCTGLRFFTVYGPYGRPDMAIFKFTDAILNQHPIALFNNGNMSRDFTYIDDAVKALVNFIDDTLPGNNIINVGSGKATSIIELISLIESATGKKDLNIENIQIPGETINTCADTSRLSSIMNWNPVEIKKGLKYFIEWYKSICRT